MTSDLHEGIAAEGRELRSRWRLGGRTLCSGAPASRGRGGAGNCRRGIHRP
ncbi:hypothetical protein ANDA3_4264 [plant metagenome]|uniref:Uncharacterized protein n=2 Tax=root TaxID=1 RepID=A0A1C3K2G1_9BURK|nr:hypothetical protein ODI_01317 [Orrella dioscoreae]SOE52140.1 hypothetical protein ODI_R3950 [Orrella dioscoreae]